MNTASIIAVSGMQAAALRLQGSAAAIAGLRSGRTPAASGPSAPADVDLAVAVTRALEARVAFAANAAVFRGEARMTAALLDVTA
ncbi:MAG: flagellar protein [Pseudolabrys sp.]|nr:flagellar protein [Pseudolabrys sp.]